MPLPLLLVAALQLASPAPRSVVITIDDLPTASVVRLDHTERARLTGRLVETLVRHRIPAIGFVNEGKLRDDSGRVDDRDVALLRTWVAAGLELGNHSRTHPDLHRIPLADYQADVAAGDSVTGALLQEYGKAPRFFRHPFLHTGRSVAVRDSFETFLAARGYRVAPVTMDNSDYVYAAAYSRALARGDSAGARLIGAGYLDYMDSVVTFYEGQAIAILGRDLPQILLLHASQLNADWLDALVTRLERRGYAFLPLERALEDPAYRLPDSYAGPAGITWLHRWAITRGIPGSVFRGEPEVPEWVARAGQPGS